MFQTEEIKKAPAHESKDIVEWQKMKLWERYNRYGEAGLKMYGNGDWKLETKQWQNGKERRIEMRNILLRGKNDK